MLPLGVDFSVGPPSASTITCWKENKVKWACAQYSMVLPAHLATMDNSGIPTDVYVYEYFPLSPWSQTPEQRMRNALQMCHGHKVGTVWPDAEDPNDAIGPAHWQANIDAMWECLNLIKDANYEAGIYSNVYRYRERFGDYDGFGKAGIKFWNADYLGESPIPDLSLMPTELVFRHGLVPGWGKPDIHQWWNTTSFCGHSVDLNALEIGGEEVIVLHNKIADWWQDRSLEVTAADQRYEGDFRADRMQARTDLGLPETAKEAIFAVYLMQGQVRFYHGQTGPVGEWVEACNVGWSGRSEYEQVRVRLAADGTCPFIVDTKTQIARVFALGYVE